MTEQDFAEPNQAQTKHANERHFWEAPDDALFTSGEIADVRRVSNSLLERERWLGIGPRYLKLRGRIVYRKRDVVQWINETTEQPEGTRPKADAQGGL
jgi:hypothetical protein